MPIVVECSNGHKSFVKDEHAGKKALCPVCRVPIRVPDPRVATVKSRRTAAAVPVVESADDDDPLEDEQPRPRKKQAGSRREALDKVHRGLGYHYAKQILLLIGLLLTLLRLIFVGPKLMGGGEAEDAAVRPVLFAAVGLMLLIVLCVRNVLGILGSLECLAVPNKSGARGLIFASLILDCFAVPIPVVTQFMDFGLLVNGLLGLTESILGLISWCLFMFFLRKLASYLDADVEADEALQLFLKGLFMLVGIPIAVVVAGIIALITCMRGFGAFLFVIVLLGILLINFLFEVLGLIGKLRHTIHPVESA